MDFTEVTLTDGTVFLFKNSRVDATSPVILKVTGTRYIEDEETGNDVELSKYSVCVFPWTSVRSVLHDP